MIHEAYMPVYMGSRFLARDGRTEVVQEALADLKTGEYVLCVGATNYIAACSSLFLHTSLSGNVVTSAPLPNMGQKTEHYFY